VGNQTAEVVEAQLDLILYFLCVLLHYITLFLQEFKLIILAHNEVFDSYYFLHKM